MIFKEETAKKNGGRSAPQRIAKVTAVTFARKVFSAFANQRSSKAARNRFCKQNRQPANPARPGYTILVLRTASYSDFFNSMRPAFSKDAGPFLFIFISFSPCISRMNSL